MLTDIMKINILPIDSQNPDSSKIIKVAEMLKNSELVVAPTETRYGLLGRADSSFAMDRLYRIKRRPKSMPTALFVKSIQDISNYAVMTPGALKLADIYLPGPLTLVLESACNLPSPIVVDNKIGIRYSSSPFIEMLLYKIDFPVTATSANLYKASESRNIQEIISVFKDTIGLYIDGGELVNNVSTVVDISKDYPVILREGAVSKIEILELFSYGK